MLVATAEFSGSLSAATRPVAEFAAEIETSLPWPLIEATVSTWRQEALFGAAVQLGVRVVLAGDDVSAYLTGEVSIRASLGETIARGTLELSGHRWLAHRTETTWTRSEVEVRRVFGPAGGETSEEIWLRGVVVSSKPTSRGVRLEFADRGYLWASSDACITLAPGLGLSLGQACWQVATSAGILETDIPAGPSMSQGLEGRGQQVHRLLEALGRRAGWFWRTRPDGVLEAFTAFLAPTPDQVWNIEELDALPEVTPPGPDVPSRIVYRGRTKVEVADGLIKETIVTEVREAYAPRQAVFRQNSSGARDPVAYAQTASLRVTSRTREVITKLGGLVIERQVDQEAMYNPEKGIYTTGTTPGGGPAELGLYYLDVLIDESGRGVQFFAERLMLVARERERFKYDAEGTVVAKEWRRWTYRRRTRAIRNAWSDDANIADTIVDEGLGSWAHEGNGLLEAFGLEQETRTAYAYGTTGALETESVTTSSYYSPRCNVEEDGGGHVLASGFGQVEVTATWRVTAVEKKVNTLDSSGRLAGELSQVFRFFAALSPSGPRHWGSEEYSASTSEVFRQVRSESRTYTVESRGSYRLAEEKDGVRTDRLVPGSPPLPRYRASTWTRWVDQPIEASFEDETLRTWFGFSRRVVEDPWAESLEELEAIAARERDRELSLQIAIQRPVAFVNLGETIRLQVPEMGLDVLALVVDMEEAIGVVTPTSRGRYLVEVPLW